MTYSYLFHLSQHFTSTTLFSFFFSYYSIHHSLFPSIIIFSSFLHLLSTISHCCILSFLCCHSLSPSIFFIFFLISLPFTFIIDVTSPRQKINSSKFQSLFPWPFNLPPPLLPIPPFPFSTCALLLLLFSPPFSIHSLVSSSSVPACLLPLNPCVSP